MVEPSAVAMSTSDGNSCDGRLSMTRQPPSSSAFAAVDRPAPDIPVTMMMCATLSVMVFSDYPRLSLALMDSSIRWAVSSPIPGTLSNSAFVAARTAVGLPKWAMRA
jgi:hypothetical protein